MVLQEAEMSSLYLPRMSDGTTLINIKCSYGNLNYGENDGTISVEGYVPYL
jgi:hypothetical protein